MLVSPCPPDFQSGKYHWLILMPPTLFICVHFVTTPSWGAAAATTSLTVDPGGYVPYIALLNKGRDSLSRIFLSSPGSMPFVNILLSKPGRLTSANISSLRGSRAIATPFCFLSLFNDFWREPSSCVWILES